MLFHADKNVKGNLLQMYKKDAYDYAQRKNEIRSKKVEEEREYLENVFRKEQQEEDKKKLEKINRINVTMNEYKEMINHQGDPRLRRHKLEEVKINTYGVNLNQDNLNKNLERNSSSPHYLNTVTNVSQNNNNIQFDNYQDKNNFNLNRFQKIEQQKLYKEYLDSQVN